MFMFITTWLRRQVPEHLFSFSTCLLFSASLGFFPCISMCITYLKAPNRRGTQFHAEKLPNFVLSSPIGPTGDQNDV